MTALSRETRIAEIRALTDSYESNTTALDAMGLPAGYGVVRLDLMRELLDLAALPPEPSALRTLLIQATDWLDAMAKGNPLRDGPSLWEATDFVERARAALGPPQ